MDERSNDPVAVRPVGWRRSLPLVLSLSTASLIAVAVVAPAALTDDEATTAARQVCGALRPDAGFGEELRQLGRAHACEHLHFRTGSGLLPTSGHHSSDLSLVAAAAV